MLLNPVSTSRVYLYIIAALLVLSIALGGLWFYRGTVIDAQSEQLSKQRDAIALFEKDQTAQQEADSQLQADKERIARERDVLKKKLNNALKDNQCNDVPFDDGTQRVLNELYGKPSS